MHLNYYRQLLKSCEIKNILLIKGLICMRKEDRRNAYTEKLIRDTVFNLLKTKPIEKISVTEVCKTAEINRSTFYLHYMDCMHVLEKEQEKFCDKLIAYLEQSRNGEALDIVEEMHRLVREDHDFYLLLMRSGNPAVVFAKFFDYCRGYLSTKIRQNCALTETECNWVAQYIIAGSFAISTLFAEEKEVDRDREEIFHNLTAGGIAELARKYPKQSY